MVDKYPVITLCGSTRFKNEFMMAQKRLTLEGNIVISVGLFGHSGDEEVWENMDEGTLTKTKKILDDMHKSKIDMSDEIFVINKDGYIGDSTRSEIEYARDHGKKVRYYENRISTLKMLIALREKLQDSKGGEWIIDHKNDGSPEHPMQMPFVNFTAEMEEFIKRVYDVELVFPEFELRSYQKVLEKNGLKWNGDSLKKADISKLDEQGIMAVMLGAIRADRFCEGALLGVYKDGYIDKWLGRLEELVSGSDNQSQYTEENSKNRIVIVKKNITRLRVDAIVNAANEELRAGGGVCGAIFAEAGHSQLQEACNRIGHCNTGKAVITPGFKLPAKYIIHAVGPVWHGGDHGEKKLLYSCYQESMKLAQENDIHSIAFPLISAGIFGVPADVAWRKAVQAVSEYQAGHPEADIKVTFAVLDDRIMAEGQRCLGEIAG